MAHHFDEHELLALIEGELTEANESALRGRLASDPTLLNAVDQMIAQRRATRGLPAPAMPCDFVAELEPMLVRSMLIDAGPAATGHDPYTPGQARRAKRAMLSHHSLPGYATAAGLLLAATAGIWVTGTGMGWWNGGGSVSDPANTNIALNDGVVNPNQSTGPNVATINSEDDDSLLWPGNAAGEVHHDLMPDALLATAGTAAGDTNATSTQLQPAAGSATVTAQFALLLERDTPDTAEADMVSVVNNSAVQAAVVRNFSFADAQALEAQWHATRRNEPTLRRPQMAGMSSAQANQQAQRFFSQLAQRAQSQLRTLRTARSNPPAAREAVLAGSTDLAADATQQLRFSSAGATHTLSVPVSELGTMLSELTDHDIDSQAMLAMFQPVNILDEPLETPRSSQLTAAERIRGMLDVRRALDELLATDRNAVVLLPVVVQPSR